MILVSRTDFPQMDGRTRISHGGILMLLAALALLLFLTASIVLDAGSISIASAGVITTFILNGTLAIVLLSKSIAERPFSLVQLHWLFYITMFVVAPLSQYLYGYSAWGHPLGDSDYLGTNVLLMIWGVFFAFASNSAGFHRPSRSGSNNVKSQSAFYESLPSISARAALIAFGVSLCSAIIVIVLVGFSNLFSRGDFVTGLDKTLGLLFDKGVRPLPVFAFVLIFARAKQQHKFTLLPIAAFLIAFIADFPAAMARYNMACLYGGIILLVLGPLFEKRGLFPALFLIAFLVLFPAGNAYRCESFEISMLFDAIRNAALNLPQGFCAVDYDAYSMVARTSQYIATFGVENGYQLLGALLFFVPRAIWPTKPEGSGNLVCAAQGQLQLNISSPLPAEGLVNFGVFGLIAFAILLGILCRKGDAWFVRSCSPLRLLYPFLCFLLFFVMRGDLLSGLAFSVGYCVSFMFLLTLCLGIDAFGGKQSKSSSGEYSPCLGASICSSHEQRRSYIMQCGEAPISTTCSNVPTIR